MTKKMNTFNEEKQDLIDRFLKGEMTKQECSGFIESLKNDKQLREQLKYTELIKTLISSRITKSQKITTWEKININNPYHFLSSPVGGSSFKIYKWVGIAVFLFSLGIMAINIITDYIFPDKNNEIPYKPLKTGEDNSSLKLDTLEIDTVKIINDSLINQK